MDDQDQQALYQRLRTEGMAPALVHAWVNQQVRDSQQILRGADATLATLRAMKARERERQQAGISPRPTNN